MKKALFITLVAILLLNVVGVALNAQTLPVDSRKQVMQFHKNFDVLRYSPPKDTLWHKIDLPVGTMEVFCVADTGAVAISLDGAYWAAGVQKYAYVSKGIPFTLPAYKKATIWVRRAVMATASNVNFIFKKM